MAFTDYEVYDRVNRKAPWEVLRMYDEDGKLLNETKSMAVNSLACIKGGEIESYKIDSWAWQGCINSHWLFNVYIDAVMKEMKIRIR